MSYTFTRSNSRTGIGGNALSIKRSQPFLNENLRNGIIKMKNIEMVF